MHERLQCCCQELFNTVRFISIPSQCYETCFEWGLLRIFAGGGRSLHAKSLLLFRDVDENKYLLYFVAFSQKQFSKESSILVLTSHKTIVKLVAHVPKNTRIRQRNNAPVAVNEWTGSPHCPFFFFSWGGEYGCHLPCLWASSHSSNFLIHHLPSFNITGLYSHRRYGVRPKHRRGLCVACQRFPASLEFLAEAQIGLLWRNSPFSSLFPKTALASVPVSGLA